DARGSQHIPVEDGEWKGWHYSTGDAFNAHVGPFYHRLREDGAPVCAMRVEARHLNGGGMMHGGALMTFADYCLYVFAATLGDPRGVRVPVGRGCGGAVRPGAVVAGTGEVSRSTGSRVVVRGLLAVGSEAVVSFAGGLRRIRPKGA